MQGTNQQRATRSGESDSSAWLFFRRLSAPRVLSGSAGLGIRAGLGEFVGPIAEQEPAEEGGGWSAAPPGRCPEHEEVGRVRTLNHIPGTGLVHR